MVLRKQTCKCMQGGMYGLMQYGKTFSIFYFRLIWLWFWLIWSWKTIIKIPNAMFNRGCLCVCPIIISWWTYILEVKTSARMYLIIRLRYHNIVSDLTICDFWKIRELGTIFYAFCTNIIIEVLCNFIVDTSSYV